jgi:hypothetical protein
VGGVALNLLGIVRTTEDLDIFVASDEDNISKLKEALQSVFNDPNIEEIMASDLSGDYPAIQYIPPEANFHIDIISRLGEAFSFEDIETERRIVDGVNISVATAHQLYKMKKDTVRLQDRADAEKLRRYFDVGE